MLYLRCVPVLTKTCFLLFAYYSLHLQRTLFLLVRLFIEVDDVDPCCQILSQHLSEVVQ